MPAPIHLYPFRYRDRLTGKWVRARYKAERHVIAERYEVWEIIGPPEVRQASDDIGYFNPGGACVVEPPSDGVDREPVLSEGERALVLLFLRRYITGRRAGTSSPSCGKRPACTVASR